MTEDLGRLRMEVTVAIGKELNKLPPADAIAILEALLDTQRQRLKPAK